MGRDLKTNPLDEIRHKKRSVNDLIRFIRNKINGDKTANYSLLLGAGASISSGIRSGKELIDVWKKEIVNDETNGSYKDNPDDYFRTEDVTWYDETNPYASLFEHRFDLQRQRRAFVEKEVAGKSPSIGYAYLVSLIENNFFNTVFTTNFDDLLNEAFYNFSQIRPIVCAQDSSISGITVTSSRPKIIKLHGDYLFENIKTTIRETESLEENMKQKFQEFAKDYGLIVIGYAGNDRSIMDVLSTLLRRDDYFKNGIYWCIKKGDEPSQELKRLLWKDRVFFVEIDGFDELMSEINDKLNDSNIPIKDDIMSLNYQRSIIRKLTENEWIKETQSPILKRDCLILKKRLDEKFKIDFFDFIIKTNNIDRDNPEIQERNEARRKSNLRPLNEEEKEKLVDLQKSKFLLSDEEFRAKLDFNKIIEYEDSEYKRILLELLANNSPTLNDNEINTVFSTLIKLNPVKEVYYLIASYRSDSFALSNDFLQQAVEAIPNDFYVHNALADLLLDHNENLIKPDDNELDKCEKEIEKSLELNPNITNRAYLLKIRYNKIRYSNELDKKKQKDAEVLQHYNNREFETPMYLDILSMVQPEQLTEDTIRKHLAFYKKADKDDMVEHCYWILINLYDTDESKKIDDVMQIMGEYEQDYIPSGILKKCKVTLLYKYDKLDEALSIINKERNPSEDYIKRKIEILSIKGCMNELDDFYNRLSRKSFNIELVYYEGKKDYQKIYDLLSAKHPDDIDNIISFSFVMLKLEKYNEVCHLLKPYYDNPSTCSGEIRINYLFASLKSDRKNIDKKLGEIIEDKMHLYNNRVKFSAFAMLNRKNDAINMLRKILKKDPAFKYMVREWPVLENLKNDATFNKLIS